VAKDRQLARHVGDLASLSANLMANFDDSNNMPEGTTFVLSSWACTANGSGGYTSHLIAPEEPKTPDNEQNQLADCSEKLGKISTTRASSALNSESVENDLAPTCLGE